MAGIPVVPHEVRVFAHNQCWAVPGGWVVYNAAAESLDAHCSCFAHRNPSNPCRLNRTRTGGRGQTARGRPLGLLLAWLRASPCHITRDRHKHMVDVKKRQPGDELFFALDKREFARQWLVDNGLNDLLGLERPQRIGEPSEPVGWA